MLFEAMVFGVICYSSPRTQLQSPCPSIPYVLGYLETSKTRVKSRGRPAGVRDKRAKAPGSRCPLRPALSPQLLNIPGHPRVSFFQLSFYPYHTRALPHIICIYGPIGALMLALSTCRQFLKKVLMMFTLTRLFLQENKFLQRRNIFSNNTNFL